MPLASSRTLLPAPSPGPYRKFISWCCLIGLLFGFAYFCPIILAVLSILTVLGILLGAQEKRRQAKLAVQRRQDSICTFVRGFDYRRVDMRVLRAIYEELQPLTVVPLRAEDELLRTLGLDDEDLDLDIAPIVAIRTGRSLENTRVNPYYDRVRTVTDLVAFFCAQPFTKTVQG